MEGGRGETRTRLRAEETRRGTNVINYPGNDSD